MLDAISLAAHAAGQRRAAYVRGIVLGTLSTGLPAMALKAAGGTGSKDVLLCVRLRTDDFKRLELVARKAGVTPSVFLRAALVRSLA